MHVLVIREMAASQRTARKLLAAGLESVVLPMVKIVRLADRLPQHDGFDATAFTSAAALPLMADMAGMSHLQKCPSFCVGNATAHAARQVGFDHVVSCGGSAQSVADKIADHAQARKLRVLYPAARDKAFDLVAACAQAGIEVVEFPLYAAELVDPGAETLENALQTCAGGAVFLHSARTARHLGQLIEKHGLETNAASLTFIAISENVAAMAKGALPAGNFRMLVAKLPEDDAMIAQTRAIAGS